MTVFAGTGIARGWHTISRGDVVRAVLVPYVIARFLVLGTLAVTRHVLDVVGPAEHPVQAGQGLLAWDAAFYADIAGGGYDAVPREGLRFFPLLPLLGRALATFPGIDANLGVLLVANGAALALGFVVYALVWRERADEGLARRAVWLTFLLPPAFVLVMGYAEALFMLLAGVALLAARSRRFWVSSLAGFLAGLSRPLGVLLAVPALVEGVRDRRRLDRRQVASRVASVVAPFAGLVTFLVWAAGRGESFLYPLRVQDDPERRGGFAFPVTNLVDAAREAGTDRLSAGVHLATALAIVVLAVVVARRWPAGYAWYAVAAVVLALSAPNLDSLERYSLSTIPVVLAAADVTAGSERERVAVALAAAGLVAASVLAFTGVLVP